MLAGLLQARNVLEKRNELASETDLSIIAITWGFTLGFGFLTTWTAVKQTRHMWKRRNGQLNHPYIWMVWGELLSCLLLSIVCWLVLQGPVSLNVWSLVIILCLWVIQVHFLFQIIINRVSILMVNRKRALQLKVATAVLITLVNISVFCIWIPAKLKVNDTYERINIIWDRIEKIIILIVDAALNYYFVRIVQKQLIKPGLTKYRPLVRFNLFMIVLSLTMDCLIIGMLSLPNTLVYLMFHPLAYIVKLNIEMSMAELIAHVSRTQETGTVQYNNQESSGYPSEDGTVSKGFGSMIFSPLKTYHSKRESLVVSPPPVQQDSDLESGKMRPQSTGPMPMGQFGIIPEEASHDEDHDDIDIGFVVHRHDEVTMEVESLPSQHSTSNVEGGGFDSRRRTQESDETPLTPDLSKNNMGVATKVWGHY